MTREQKQQFTLRITQANPTELSVILYEITLVYLQEMKEACNEQQLQEFQQAAHKVRGGINEMLQSLNMEYSPAQELRRLYLFCIRRLTYSQMHMDTQALDEIEQILTKLRDAYAQIAPSNSSAPVMSNTQSVYSGLTYGKSAALAEDVTSQSTNRGMLV